MCGPHGSAGCSNPARTAGNKPPTGSWRPHQRNSWHKTGATCGTAAKCFPMKPSRLNMPESPLNRAWRCGGRCRCGTTMTNHPTGAKRQAGAWDCWRRATGRPNGSPTGKTMVKRARRYRATGFTARLPALPIRNTRCSSTSERNNPFRRYACGPQGLSTFRIPPDSFIPSGSGWKPLQGWTSAMRSC